ncbi:lysozyme [Streptomyces sp. NPDC020845]|uniref:lysozyme n=1 Tax=Streptomyces sp. NPDC020845 TaxID=3365096 RepID=UPI00379F7D66
MSAQTGKGAHRKRPALRSPYAMGGLALAVTATLASLVPAMASTTEASEAGAARAQAPAHPERDWMGSTVAEHEGGDPKAIPKATVAATVEGVDVSNHQGTVNWTSLWNKNVRFAYVKATESTTYKNPKFASQYNGSANKGMIRGAYHFALPNKSSGTAQADYFVNNGGRWSADGKTLPPVLDIEYNPYGASCYGKTKAQMVTWIKDFSARVKKRTGRDPVIYTTTSWWKSCTGNSGAFGTKNPLWLARYASTPGALPAGWKTHTIWQYTSSGPVVGDHNKFNGSLTRLKALAKG